MELKSRQCRDILKVAPQQAIDRNLLALKDLCEVKGVQLPAPFELQYLATVMCQFTGDATQMFDRVKCFESKAHVYWSFELREPFVPHQDLSAEQRNLYYFAHGTDTAGIEGMIHSRFIAPATIADGPQAAWATILKPLRGMTTHRSLRS